MPPLNSDDNPRFSDYSDSVTWNAYKKLHVLLSTLTSLFIHVTHILKSSTFHYSIHHLPSQKHSGNNVTPNMASGSKDHAVINASDTTGMQIEPFNPTTTLPNLVAIRLDLCGRPTVSKVN